MSEKFSQVFEQLELDDKTIQGDPAETIRLPIEQETLESLPMLSVATHGPVDFVVGDTLGEGGTGVVLSATQRPFGRNVALKTVRDPGNTGESLLREAIAAGRLEHPNIIPIYAVGVDEEQRPIIVMKRVDGAEWNQLLADEPDDLEKHLRIFMQVCSAVDFAHERGILHRDVKPQNVMVGSHDDVYLVDWGLAVRLDTERDEPLPTVRDSREVCGTPHFMAPEMTTGVGEVDERTDVYLLGATLHQAVTGGSRHDGATVFEIMMSAYNSEPFEYGSDISPELAAICNRATAKNPDERYQSAGDLREAIEQFIAHRSAAKLTAEASLQVDELERWLADEEADPDRRRVAVYQAFGAARFGFERSLADWWDQPAATQGLQRALELMIEWELGHGSVHAATALLEALPERNPAMAARVRDVADGLARESQEIAELRERVRAKDISVGARARAIQMFAIVALVAVVPTSLIALGFIDPLNDPFAFWVPIPIAAVIIVAIHVIGFKYDLLPMPVGTTEMNWRLLGGLTLALVWIVVVRGFALLLDVPIPAIVAIELFTFGTFVWLFGVLLALPFFLPGVAFLAGSALALVLPEMCVYIFLFTVAAGLGLAARVWLTLDE